VANRAETDDQQNFAVELGQMLRLVPKGLLHPLAAVLAAHGIREIARQRQQQTDRVLGHWRRENSTRIGDQDSGIAQFWIHQLRDARGSGVDPLQFLRFHKLAGSQ